MTLQPDKNIETLDPASAREGKAGWRPHGSVVIVAYDLLAAVIAVSAAQYVALSGFMTHPPKYDSATVALTIVMFAAICGIVFAWHRLHLPFWRFTSLHDLVVIARATTIASLVFVPVMFLVTRAEGLPRSVPLISWVLLTGLLAAPRVAKRLLSETPVAIRRRTGDVTSVPVILAGAGRQAEAFVRNLERDPDAAYRVVALLSENAAYQGRRLFSADVLGRTADLPNALDKLAKRGAPPHRIILTGDEDTEINIEALLENATNHGLTLARLPRLTDLQSGTLDDTSVRAVALEDLLGRPQSVLDRAAMRRMIEGRSVLITGAGGSIGSELARQVASYGPSCIALLDFSEFNLYSIDVELGEKFPDVQRRAILCDVRNRERVAHWFAEATPEIVFHAAALKHVPMMEDHPLEAILTNVQGTRNIADMCLQCGVKAMVQVSTDKAVNPTNVMGATKRIAESYAQALDIAAATTTARTRFVTVRFGNVLGSTGSVVPLFQRQLAAGGPLTVTHPDITRYFMTIQEAVELILQASALGLVHDDYRGRIFMLDMGKPIKIADLARQMIRLAGKRPDADVRIHYVGLRPGEKLYEELIHDSETPLPSTHKQLFLVNPRSIGQDQIRQLLDALVEHARLGNSAAAQLALRELVPEYRPA